VTSTEQQNSSTKSTKNSANRREHSGH